MCILNNANFNIINVSTKNKLVYVWSSYYFFICFEMTTSTKSLSATQMCVRYGITEKTARLFMLKIRGAMSSSQNHQMDGNVQVDEFVLGGYE